MGRGVPGHSLQGLSGVDQALYRLVGLIHLPQRPGQTQRVVQSDMQSARPGRNLFCDLVHVGIGQVHHPPHVPNHTPGRHGTEGNNLCHMIVTVFPADIIHHLAPAGIAKVHIDIGHAYPFRV